MLLVPFSVGYYLESDNGEDEGRDEEQAQKCRRFVQEYDAENYRTHCTYAGPYRICRADGNGLHRLGQEGHAGNKTQQETVIQFIYPCIVFCGAKVHFMSETPLTIW